MELAGLFLGCGGALVALFVGLLLASVILRGAVALANRLLGPVKPPDMFGQWDDWDSDEPAPKPRKNPNRAIPEPNLATAMLVAFISGIVNCCGYIVCVILAEETFDLRGLDAWAPFAMLLVLSLPITGLILTIERVWERGSVV